MESYPKYSIRAFLEQKTPFDSHRVLKIDIHKPKVTILELSLRFGLIIQGQRNGLYLAKLTI